MSDSQLNLTKLTLLVAQRERHYCQIFSSILRSFGAENVLEACTSDDAEALLTSKNVDVLIVDADLPEMGGIELVRAIRSDDKHPARNIPILISMGECMRTEVMRARDAGAHIVIQKPVSPEIVFDRLAWIANHPRAFWDSASYYGPDRRFRSVDAALPEGRRTSDMTETLIDDVFMTEEEEVSDAQFGT